MHTSTTEPERFNLPQFAADLAAHLPGFTVDPKTEPYAFHLRLVHADGRALSLNSSRASNGREVRLYVAGIYPQDDGRGMGARDWGVIAYDQTAPDMTCNTARGAEACAKDILRRLLPVYTDLYEKARVEAARRSEHRNGGLTLAAELAVTMRADLSTQASRDQPAGRMSTRGHSEYGDFRVNGPDSVTMTFHVEAATARRLAKAWRDGAK